ALAPLDQKLQSNIEQVRKLLADSDFVALETLLQGEFQAASKDYLAGVTALQQLAESHAAASSETAQAHTRTAAIVTVSLVALSVAFASAFGFWLSRSIGLPLRGAAQQARAIAQGDLSIDVSVTDHGEIGELQQAIHEMQSGLQELVGKVQMASE